jgi:hypothetical protein
MTAVASTKAKLERLEAITATFVRIPTPAIEPAMPSPTAARNWPWNAWRTGAVNQKH